MNTVMTDTLWAEEDDEAMRKARNARVLPFVSGTELAEKMLAAPSLEPEAGAQAAVIEALTIRETSFFRSPTMFRLLCERVIPALVEGNRGVRRLRLWSAGCATGQEVYSLAILLCERFPELATWDVQITGTDISSQACLYARRGRYSRFEISRGLPAQTMLKYFDRDENSWSVGDRLRGMVRIRCADLRVPTLETYDLVLLRNVLLYLPSSERARVLASIYLSMRPEARLMLGAAEQMEESFGLFEARSMNDHCVYAAVSA